MQVDSIGGSRYILTFLDDSSHKTFVYFLKSKDEVYEHFKTFKNLVENQTERKIKTFRTDNGGEYCGKNMYELIKSSGIVHQTSCSFTPMQNGRAERLNRSIMDKARCMLIEAGLPHYFWAEAVNTAVYLLNRSPCKSVEKTPEEMWTGRVPTLSHLHIFGCKAFGHVPTEKRKKLDHRSTPSIFIGYCTDKKAYRLYDPKRQSVFVSRDVTFDETTFGSSMLDASDVRENKTFYYFPDDPVYDGERRVEQEIQSNDVQNTTPLSVERNQRERRPPKHLEDYETYLAISKDCLDPVSVEEALDSSEKDL
uniref:Integrase catalytic domain-containing protein n=1 Tax=Photinus pyralis TaxID=7054 RepID=A0A1Y1L7N3_PHOPY